MNTYTLTGVSYTTCFLQWLSNARVPVCAFSKQADRKIGSYDKTDAMGELNFLWNVTSLHNIRCTSAFWISFCYKEIFMYHTWEKYLKIQCVIDILV